jgi:serine/threonine protein kinase
MAADTPTLDVIEQRPGCIAIGWSGVICKIGDTHIVKHPKFFANHHTYNEQFYDLITLERNIYERLGDHKGIIKYLGVEDKDTGAIKLAYAKQGDLATYIQHHDIPPESFRTRWIQLLIETFYHVYCYKVLHQDIKLNNILVDGDCLKVIDLRTAHSSHWMLIWKPYARTILYHESISSVLAVSCTLSLHGGSLYTIISRRTAGQHKKSFHRPVTLSLETLFRSVGRISIAPLRSFKKTSRLG